MSALVADSIRKYIDKDYFTMFRDDEWFAEVDLKESITFQALVNLVMRNGSPNRGRTD